MKPPLKLRLSSPSGGKPETPEALFGSPQEFVSNGILRGFLDVLKSDIFGIGNGHAASLQ